MGEGLQGGRLEGGLRKAFREFEKGLGA